MSETNISLKQKLEAYIATHYELMTVAFKRVDSAVKKQQSHPQAEALHDIFVLDEPFIERLYKLIDASGKSDVEIYKKAGIDRRHYAKIKNPAYVPHKKTIVAFIFALELSLASAEDLLSTAGMALSPSYLFDVIVRFYLEEKIYDIALINETLLAYDQPLIGF